MTRSQFHLSAKPGERDALLRDLDRLEVFVAVRGQPGFLGLMVLVPDGDADGVLVEGSWSSPEHFWRWWESPAQEDLLRDLGPRLAKDLDLVLYHVVDTIS